MVEILPFKGLRYSIKKIGSYSKVLAPPYDVIDENQKIILKNFSPYNIVHLTLPDDTDKKNRYESARDILSGWINEEILEPDRDESFYIFRENFMEEGVKKSFAGFAALLKIEEYDEGTVLRHEKTLPKPKEDRLNLLTACRTNFEFIYTVFDDHDKKVTDIINATMQHIPDVASDVLYDKTLSFDLWTVKNKKDLEKITGLMKNKTVLIADGHHRYETSRLYRESTEKPDLLKPENIKTAEDYIMCLFVPGIQKEISIHPTHRLIKFAGEITAAEILEKLSFCFAIKKIPDDENTIIRKMKEASFAGKKCICIYFKDSSCYSVELALDLESAYKQLNAAVDPFIGEFEYLDVNILHKLVLSELLKESKVEEIKFLHTIKEVREQLLNKSSAISFDAGFILNSPAIETVHCLSNRGMIMPQKSTYFYPKPCSGLVLYKFDNNGN